MIAAFLYSGAINIKIPLLPLMVYYFGALFVVVLLPYIVIASLVEGEIIELIERRKKTKYNKVFIIIGGLKWRN